MYRLKTKTLGGSRFRGLSRWGAIAFACCLLSTRPAWAAPVTAATAASAVQGWLHQDRRPLGRELSAKIKSTQAVKNAAGEVLYYVVKLDPSGFVILPADDLAEPIVAFSATGNFDASSGSTMAAMVNHDIPQRLKRARTGAPAASVLRSRGKWHAFLAGSPNPPPDAEENGGIVVASQVWVAPLVQTLWNQLADVSEQDACYNYFTPPFATGNISNDPCGCVATALAQEMYYFQYPNTGVGTASFTITNNGTPQTNQLRGGDGAGGPYLWDQMPLSPDSPTTNQAGAIGALICDAGTAVSMSYTPELSSAYTILAQQALTSTFKFANAAYFENSSGLSGANLLNMINPSLDARLPVILGVEFDGGHCLLCDGYGYSSSTLFHHLNLGYAGDDDIWYTLPEIDTADAGTFTVVEACIYNIYTNGSGQIISGRVTDPTGAPVAGATVTAVRIGGGTYTATADTNGIYALARIPAASTYALTVTNVGGSSATENYSTGTSVFLQLSSGNVWGADFVLSPSLLAIPETGFASIGPSNGPFSPVSQLYNLKNLSASPINWALSNTNNWLSVTASNGTVAAGAFSILTISLNTNANTNAPGTYSGSIWITNLNNGLPQGLSFSLTVASEDYPIAVTGFNLDVVVESNAVGGVTTNYADAFDPACAFLLPTPPPVCFYEAGLVATNILHLGLATNGLPPGGLFTSLADGTTFQFGPYDSSNVLYLTPGAPSGSLTLNTPMACKSLRVLAASAQGGGTGTLVIHFADGTASSAINFNATNYLTTNAPSSFAAITNFGLLDIGGYNQFYSFDTNIYFPSLYQSDVNLQFLSLNTNLLITSVTFTMPTNGPSITPNTVTGVFALSGMAAAYTSNYILTASASPANGGMVSGAGSFAAGSSPTVTATANSGYIFANWTQGGIVASTSPSYTNTLNGDETLVANFLPAYTLTVTASPTNGGTVSGGGVFLAGSSDTNVTATANSGFEFIGWTGDATGTNSPLSVTVNTNLNLTANFAAIGANITLLVLTNGYGTVSPNLNGKVLTAGRNYTLRATAASGNVFSNWAGSITTNKNPLTIKAETNLVLQANFITNPFLPVKGIYNGLFTATNGIVTEQTAGMLKGLTISTKGTYSGSLLINGAGHVMVGSFDLAGQATNKILRPNVQGGPLLVEMTLMISTNSAPQVTGTVSGTNNGVPWVATNLLAGLATNVLPSAEYTMLIPPNANTTSTNSPGGYGYALITNYPGTAKNPAAATARITGALADGTAFDQTVPVAQDGSVPIYANLYAGKGLLLGWINLNLTNTNAVTGLTWIHPTRTTGLYPQGFTNVLLPGQILFSPWTNPPPDIIMTNMTNLLFLQTLSATNAYSYQVMTTPDTVTGSGVSGTINPKTGLLTASIGSGTFKLTGHGAILLNTTNGGGYFLYGTNAEAIVLTNTPFELAP